MVFGKDEKTWQDLTAYWTSREIHQQPGVRQLKIHECLESGLVPLFLCQVFDSFCCMDVVWRCTLWYNVFGGLLL